MLIVVAEIAVAFAGFASLVAIIGVRRGRDMPALDSARLRSMLQSSLLVIAFSLFPFLPLSAGFAHDLAYRISAGSLSVCGFALTVYQGIRARQVTGYDHSPRRRVVAVFILSTATTATLVLALGAFGVFEGVATAFLFGLFSYLALAALFFFRLVGSLLMSSTETPPV